jgi:hypothetical protein
MSVVTMPCPQAIAFQALCDHTKVCHPCAMLFAGIGRDRYEHCARWHELAKAHEQARCTCRFRLD